MPPSTRQKRPLADADPNENATKKVKATAQERNAARPGVPNYDDLLLPDLKAKLKTRGLMISGSRFDLVRRLEQADHDSSLPVKQAMEANARKRREQAAARSKPGSKPEDSLDRKFARDIKRKEEVLQRGPMGKPVYDDMGYQLSYEKLKKQPKTFRKSAASFKRMNEYFDKKKWEHEKKAEIMGLEKPLSTGTSLTMDWRVAKDLQIPLHRVEICDYEQWRAQGFTVKTEELDDKAITEKEREWTTRLSMGCAFRK